MVLGHLLTRSGLTYPEVSSNVCHDSFCQSGNSVSLPWVIYCEAFYLHVASSFSCIPVIFSKLVFFLNSFAICVFVLQSVQVYPAVLLMYFVSAAVILLESLIRIFGCKTAATGQRPDVDYQQGHRPPFSPEIRV